ncbi:MAG TPA: translation initiation factor IF-3 [Rhodanobacteraceae bacterium]
MPPPGENLIVTPDTKRNRRNLEIRVPRVRVIDADGEQAGILSRDDALNMAQEAGLDLVEIQPNSDPPVCRIMDFGKFLFEQQKKANAQRKKTKQVEIKEVKFRPVTEEGDYQIKMRNVLKFLEVGNKVKVTIRFRGREMRHMEIGRELAERIQKEIGELGAVEQFPQQEGRQMTMMIGPPRKK